MITYIVPITITNPDNVLPWSEFMLKHHIPLVMKTEFPLMFSGKIYRENPVNGEVGVKFQVHYFFQNEDDLKKYRETFGEALKNDYDVHGWGLKAPVGERYTISSLN